MTEKEKFYQCRICQFVYDEKEWAEKCREWCREHDVCSTAITAHSITLKGHTSFPSADNKHLKNTPRSSVELNMAKQSSKMETAEITKQPVLNIGMVGHIDHGKTTLLYKLSGKWTDTHSEELKRGITIKLGYADSTIRKCSECNEYTTKEKCPRDNSVTTIAKYISFVDAPGHEMLMATMLSGAAIIDAAILVIAANEPCPRPQTKEHLVALDAKGISNVIIVQNKVDLVTKEQALESYKQIKEFVKGSIAENAPIVPCSAQQEINLSAIFAEIDRIKVPERDVSSYPVFFVARSFDINKPGTKAAELKGGVLGGVLKQGILHIGDELEIKPGLAVKKHEMTEYKTITTKIVALYSGNHELHEASPSGSLAIQTELSPELTKADALAGCVVSTKGSLPELQTRVKVKVKLFNEVLGTEKKQAVDQIRTNEMILLSVNTAVTVGPVLKILPGDIIELSLKIPIVPLKGNKIGIARNLQGHWRLIGWGEIM